MNLEQAISTLIDKADVSFIASIDGDGFPNIKAMLPPRKREGLREFYFTTNTSSMRVGQYRINPKASVYFCDKRFFIGIMFIGIMEVLEDNDSKEMIWREGDLMYYPLGVTDPDYCVLKFSAEKVRYYSNFKSESFIISQKPSIHNTINQEQEV